MKPLISIGGGSCSGKTLAAKIAKEELSAAGKSYFALSQDNFYHNIPPHFTIEDKRNMDRDEPGSIDFKLNRKKVMSLLQGYEAELEKYSYHAGQRFPWKTVRLEHGLVFEGLYALHPEFLEPFKSRAVKVFIDANLNVMLKRRLDRKREGGDESVFEERWNKQVVPAYRNFIRPTKAHADYVINNNKLSLDEFRQEIRNILEKSKLI